MEEEVDIPEGDYSIQVNIIEVMDIKGANASGLSDPFVSVDVLGQKRRTEHKHDVSGAFFNETFYFNFKDLKKDQIMEAHLTMSLYDHNWFRSNELIGLYSVSFVSSTVQKFG